MWRVGPILALLAGLAACAPTVPDSASITATNTAETPKRGGGVFAALFQSTSKTSTAPGTDRKGVTPLDQAKLANGAVTVRGPRGYCVDPATLKPGGLNSFALLASCRILSAGETGSAVAPAVITVSVGPRNRSAALPSPDALAEAFGAPLLARRENDGIVLAQVGAGGDAYFPGATRHWRATTRINDRLISLALYARQGDALTGRRGADMLIDTVRRMRRASAEAAPTPAPQGGGLLSRLFPQGNSR